MVLVVDNYDSFTYNIVHYLHELGADVQVLKHDDERLNNATEAGYSHVIISPGPKSPLQAGLSLQVISQCQGRIPLLGVCLGHQSLAVALGGKTRHANRLMHAKTSIISHNGEGVFKGLPNKYHVVRYHSLVVDEHTLPNEFDVTAWSEDEHGQAEEIMAIKHKHWPIEGVQFHPESIGSEHGHALFNNFLTSSTTP